MLRFSLLPILLSIHFTASAATKTAVSKGMADACAKIVAQSATSDPRAVMAHVIGQGLDMNRLRGRLEELSGAKPMADGFVLKERGSKAGRMIARLRISEMLSEMGLKPKYETFDIGANVIAEIKGTRYPSKVIELAAHYDSVGNPGADDNGSGVALLLELALYMQQFKPEYTIRFIFNDLEETGHHGAIYHTKKIKEDQKNEVIGAIVIDTIGWGAQGGKHYLAVVEVGEKEDQLTDDAYDAQELFAAEMFYLLNRIGNRDGVKFSPETGDALPGTADHGPYWDAGIPAILIAAPYEDGFINPGYHQDSDTVDGMNWEYYEFVSQTITELLAFKSGAYIKLKPNEIGNWTALEDPRVELDIELVKQSLERDPALPPRPKPKPLFTWPKYDEPREPKPEPKSEPLWEQPPIALPPPVKVEEPKTVEPAMTEPEVVEPEPKRTGFFANLAAFWRGLTGTSD